MGRLHLCFVVLLFFCVFVLFLLFLLMLHLGCVYVFRHLMRPDKALSLFWKYKLVAGLVGRKPGIPSARLVMPPSAQIIRLRSSQLLIPVLCKFVFPYTTLNFYVG